MFFSTWGGIGGRLEFSNGLDTGFGVVAASVVAVAAGGRATVCVIVVANPSPVPLPASRKGATEGGCPDSVPAARSCAPTQLPRGEG